MVLAEEFMEGPLYSIDAYIDNEGIATYCPSVRTITAAEAGKEDYYGFIQTTPSDLDEMQEEELKRISQMAVIAVGLRNSSSHIELIKTLDGFKIVELGPRTGGQRPTIYALSHGIKHSLNDVLTRVHGEVPILGEFKKYSSYIKLYATEEGIVDSIEGLEELQKLSSYVSHTNIIKPGEQFVFSRNGGPGVIDLIMANADQAILAEDIKKADSMVKYRINNL